MIGLLVGATLFLALVNGANDNFKGVATLAGSGVLSFRRALALATLSTLAGSLLSVALAAGLVRAFSAKGLVPDAVLVPSFLAAVAAGAALTVLVATVIGMPISTTHALLGGLAGAGFVRAGSDLRFGLLLAAFALPLLASPLLSAALAAGFARGGGGAARRFGVTPNTCVCVGRPSGSRSARCQARRRPRASSPPASARKPNAGSSTTDTWPASPRTPWPLPVTS